MNYSLLNDEHDLNFDLNPRLLQYMKAVEYHNLHNIKPPISLDKQFQITKSDRFILDKHMEYKKIKDKNKEIGPKYIGYKRTIKQKLIGPTIEKNNEMSKYNVGIEDTYKDFNKLKKPTTKCNGNSCAIYSSIKDFDRSLLGEKLKTNRHPLTYDTYNLKDADYKLHRDSHPYSYNSEILTRKSPYTTDTKTINRLIVDEQMKETKEPTFNETIQSSCNTCDINKPCDDKYNLSIKRDKQEKPMKFVSLDLNNTPGVYKKGSHVHGNIIDFDTKLRYSTSQDKKKGKFVSKMDTSNKWIDYQNTECQKIPNREQIQYQTTPFMGHGKGIGNVDVESSMLHSEPSRIPGHNDLGGVSINRFEDLFINVQEKSVYPFNFPRGGMSSRDPNLYDYQPAKII